MISYASIVSGIRRPAWSFALAATSVLSAGGPSAHAASVSTEYATSLYGIVLARSTFESQIGRDAFDVRGGLSSSGLASVFDDTRATISVTGRFEGGSAVPRTYALDYVSDKKRKKTVISFDGGRVVSAENTPPVKTDRPDWVPVEAEHLAGVLDPLSATLVRADSPAAVCDRVLRVFDGAMRADLKLTFAGYGRAAIRGYRGQTVSCTGRFLPVSGYRKGNKSIDFLRRSSDIAIAFAPIAGSGVYAPVEATVGTRVGTIKVTAVRFETSN